MSEKEDLGTGAARLRDQNGPSLPEDPDGTREAEALSALDRILDAPETERLQILGRLDPALRRRVEQLLSQFETASVLDGDAADQLPGLLAEVSGHAEEPKTAFVGRRLGPYRLTEPIGQGGMGRVFRAQRADGSFEQEVAVKVLRWDLEGDLARDRFERERQLLADLNHPQIPRLLDGGVTDEGLPYLVTELVEDAFPIDEFCEREALGLEDRLRLFRSVCEVVAAAHRRLVVHRDLKPGNILVGPDGQPKLLDFGVARLADGEGDQITRTTSSGLLTPRFAAPEQIDGQAIDTTVDVYALGALLYHLLVGHPPHAAGNPPVAELLRRVLTEDAPLASRAVRDAATSNPGEAHGVFPAQRLRGDLDAILACALERDPERRYAAVTDLSDDVDNFLHQHPVEARRAGTVYRARKLLRRRWPSVAAAALLLLSIGVGAISTAWQARRANERAREAAREAQRANSIVDMLVEVFDGENLAGGTPLQTAEVLLDRSARRAEERLAEQPDALADLLFNLGRSYRHLGLFDDAQAVLSRAEENALRSADSRPDFLARIRWQRSGTASDGYDWTLAEQHARAGLDYLESGGVGAETGELAAKLWLSLARAQAATRSSDPLESLERGLRLAGEVDVETARFADVVRARVAMEAEDYATAERHYRSVLEQDLEGAGGESLEVEASSYNNVATAVRRQGRLDEAAELYRSALQIVERRSGESHAQAVIVRNNLLGVLSQLGRGDEALDLSHHQLQLLEELRSTDRWRIGQAHTVHAMLLCQLGSCGEGETNLRAALSVYGESLEPGHDWTRAAELRLLALRAMKAEREQAGELEEELRFRLAQEKDPAVGLALAQVRIILDAYGRTELLQNSA